VRLFQTPPSADPNSEKIGTIPGIRTKQTPSPQKISHSTRQRPLNDPSTTPDRPLIFPSHPILRARAPVFGAFSRAIRNRPNTNNASALRIVFPQPRHYQHEAALRSSRCSFSFPSMAKAQRPPKILREFRRNLFFLPTISTNNKKTNTITPKDKPSKAIESHPRATESHGNATKCHRYPTRDPAAAHNPLFRYILANQRNGRARISARATRGGNEHANTAFS
jgi:hypothetical protein